MKEKHFQGINGNALKLIAIVTMFIDHIGAVVIERGVLRDSPTLSLTHIAALWSISFWWRLDLILRLIGRVSFPIFAFLLVEGFLHTKNVKKYGIRLLVFGLLSEIPFDLAVFQTPFYPGYQNVFFTLFLGLLALAGLQKWEYDESLWKSTAVVALCCVTASLIKSDYGAFGVVFVVILYMTREKPWLQTIAGGLAVIWELTAFLAFIPIRLYDGTRGKKGLKYLFYAFYPLHFLLLYVIRRHFV